ncbi:MAG: right-handed parallel beta-helix repeat-containing protein, partial [Halobacteriota archaeon]
EAYAVGTVTSTNASAERVGAFVGASTSSGSETDSYWNTETARQASAFGSGSGDATGLTTAEMTGMNATRNMDGLEFYDTWVPTNGGYPELAVLAGDDCTAIFGPTTIDEAGCYVMTENVTDYDGDSVITVTASNVTIDGNGSIIDGDDDTTTGTAAISVEGASGDRVSNVTIRNFSGLSDFEYPIQMAYTDNSTVENVTTESASAAGIYLENSYDSEIRNVTSRLNGNGGTTDGGLSLYKSDRNLITDSNVSANPDHGIYNHRSDDTTIRDTRVSRNDEHGIVVDSSTDVTVDGSNASDNAKSGIHDFISDSTTITDSRANGNEYGIELIQSTGTTVTNTTTNDNERGLTLDRYEDGPEDVRIVDHTATGNSDWTFYHQPYYYIPQNVSIIDHDGTDTLRVHNVQYKDVSSPPSPPDGYENVTGYLDVSQTDSSVDAYFNRTWRYDDGDVTQLDESSLAVWRYDGSEWIEAESSTVDTGENRLVANLTSFGTVAVLGDSLYAGGDGSESNPYRIEDWYHLDNVRENLGSNFELAADLDESTDGYDDVASATANDAKGFEPVGTGPSSFEGSFDGQGHTVSNLSVNRSNGNDVGLFGSSGDESTISNVTLRASAVTGSNDVGSLIGDNKGTVSNASASGSVRGGNYVGGLVGQNNEGTIRESSASVSVDGTSHVGGLVGHNTHGGESGGVLTASIATGTVNGSDGVGGLVGKHDGDALNESVATGSVEGRDRVGGLVGYGAGPMSEVAARGNVTGNDTVGGLVGESWDTVSEAYAVGTVTSTNASAERVGAFVGASTSSGSETDAYWNTETARQASAFGSGSGDTTGLTTAEMTGAAATENMTNLTFDDSWVTTDGYSVVNDHVTGLTLELGTTSLTDGDTTEATVTLSLLGGISESASSVVNYSSTDVDIVSTSGTTVSAGSAGSATVAASHAGRSDSVGVDISAVSTGGGGGSSGSRSTTTGDEETTDDDDVTITEDDVITEETVETEIDEETTDDDDVTITEDDVITEETVETEIDEETGETRVETTETTVASITFEDTIEGEITVRDLDSTPDEIAAPSGSAVQIIEITVPEGTSEARAKIQTRVERETVQAMEVTPEELVVTRYSDDQWQHLATEIVEDDETIVLEAETPGFSLFAVAIEEPDSESEDATVRDDSIGESDTDEDVGTPDSGGEDSGTPEGNDDTTDDGTPGFSVGITLVAIGILLLAGRQFRTGG